MKPEIKAKILFLVIVGFMLTALVNTFAANDKWWGYTGSGGASGSLRDVPVTSVKQARNMRDDAAVAVEGKIERVLKRELYLLNDGDDSITVEIERHLWYGLIVSPDDTIIIYGELDKNKDRVVLEARRIIKKERQSS